MELQLYIAAGNLLKVKELVKSGTNINYIDPGGNTPLIMASCYGHVDIVKFLVEHGADINKSNNKGAIALMYSHNKEIAKCLIKHGAIINEKCCFGNTAIMAGASSNDVELFNYYIKCGAKLNIKNCDGYTVLSFTKDKTRLYLQMIVLKRIKL